MDFIVGVMTIFIIVVGALWVFVTTCDTVKSIGRTGKAIEKWNDEKLGKK